MKNIYIKNKKKIISLAVIILVIGIVTITNLVITLIEKTINFFNYQENTITKQVVTQQVITPIIETEATKVASWYDYTLGNIDENLDGHKVLWSKTHRTAASRDLPRYSTARVTNIDNGKSVDVFINDYGPEEWTGRDIDLSSFAFNAISDLKLGLVNVKIELLR